MNQKLIKANIALFTGDRAETLRLLDEYRSEHPENRTHPQVLWLTAHAQINQDECLRWLQDLVRTANPENHYSRMARDYLALEEAYHVKLNASTMPRITFTHLWRLSVVLLLLALIGVVLSRSPDPSLTTAAIPTSPPSVQMTPTAPIDRSEALVAEGFAKRYDAGILKVTSLEDRSERVVDAEGRAVSPVIGGRFYVLGLEFECRAGICNNPPESELMIQLDNGNTLPVRTGVRVLSQDQLQPIALGRITRGWVVFEIPMISRVESLVIRPRTEIGTTPVILTITLPTP
jgi:hypothetical protein